MGVVTRLGECRSAGIAHTRPATLAFNEGAAPHTGGRAACRYHKERGSLQLTIGTGCASVPITGSDDILRARLVHGYSMFFGWSTIVSLGACAHRNRTGYGVSGAPQACG